MPATLPLTMISIDAAMPIIAPPMNEVMGVK